MTMNSKRSKPKNKAEAGLCSCVGCRRPRHDSSLECLEIQGEFSSSVARGGTRSVFCTYHRDEFFYLDMAPEVNVTGIHAPISGLYRRIRKEQSAVLDRYFASDVRRKMENMLSVSPPDNLCIHMGTRRRFDGTMYVEVVIRCNARVIHDSNLCPKHLRTYLIRRHKREYSRGIHFSRILEEEDQDPSEWIFRPSALPETMPEEVKEEMARIASVVTPDIMESSKCRYLDSKGEFCLRMVDDFMHLGYCKTHIHYSQAILCIMRRHKVLRCGKMLPNLLEIACSYI